MQILAKTRARNAYSSNFPYHIFDNVRVRNYRFEAALQLLLHRQNIFTNWLMSMLMGQTPQVYKEKCTKLSVKSLLHFGKQRAKQMTHHRELGPR